MTYFDYIEHKGRPGPFDHPPVRDDVVEFPDILVTEEEGSDDTIRRFRAAEDRLTPELTP